MEMYSSGRKRSHSKCDRSARARGFDSHHLRLQRKQIQAAGKWIHFPAVCVILSAPSCGEGNRPRSPGRLKACGLSLMRLSPHIREWKKTVPGTARLGACRSLPGFLPLTAARLVAKKRCTFKRKYYIILMNVYKTPCRTAGVWGVLGTDGGLRREQQKRSGMEESLKE